EFLRGDVIGLQLQRLHFRRLLLKAQTHGEFGHGTVGLVLCSGLGEYQRSAQQRYRKAQPDAFLGHLMPSSLQVVDAPRYRPEACITILAARRTGTCLRATRTYPCSINDQGPFRGPGALTTGRVDSVQSRQGLRGDVFDAADA